MKEKCKNCARPSKACISYIMTLSTQETLEWCMMWKERFGWSNAVMAEKSNVPVGTINRLFRHSNIEDVAAGVKLATIRPIICALTGCTMEELESCESHVDVAAARADDRQKIEYLKERVEYLKQQIAFKEHQMEEKDALLKEHGIIISERGAFMKRKDRIIITLAILLGLSWLVIIGALIITA